MDVDFISLKPKETIVRGMVILLLVTARLAFCQADDSAKKVYNQSQDAVFLIYLNDSSGNTTALGSGFLVGPKLLITNAHVVEAGDPVLAVGPVRLPLKIIRVDRTNDLALLSVDASLTSAVLPLSVDQPTPGEQIFAIGNPEGLEKTISQGIVSGIRKRGDRQLIQITSPISHGSSGGPILNFKGEVVGVAVGVLEDGQNLNFAVPVGFVRKILEAKSPENAVPTSLTAKLADAEALAKKRGQEEYSSSEDSPYQKETSELLRDLRELTSDSVEASTLTAVACIGTGAIDLNEEGIRAARKLVSIKPTVESRSLLAYVLWDRSTSEAFISAVSTKNSEDERQADAARARFAEEAEKTAHEATAGVKGAQALVGNFVLGNVKQFQDKNLEAIPLHMQVALSKPQVCGNDLAPYAYRNLVSEMNATNQPDQAEKWFRLYSTEFKPSAYDWDQEGDRRSSAKDFPTAAEAYERAAESASSYGYDSCFAAVDQYLQPKQNDDKLLSDGRKCIENSVKYTDDSSQTQYKHELPFVYKAMAETLEARGVYQQALEYIKQSLAALPDNAFALGDEAKIFEDLERYPECIAAAKAAISVSDGKYPSLSFRLGSCYFDTENWVQAEASFKIAAQGDPTDAASAFNIGLSETRQGYQGDATYWFREALKRNPDSELKEKIMRALK